MAEYPVFGITIQALIVGHVLNYSDSGDLELVKHLNAFHHIDIG